MILNSFRNMSGDFFLNFSRDFTRSSLDSSSENSSKIVFLVIFLNISSGLFQIFQRYHHILIQVLFRNSIRSPLWILSRNLYYNFGKDSFRIISIKSSRNSWVCSSRDYSNEFFKRNLFSECNLFIGDCFCFVLKQMKLLQKVWIMH